MGENNAYHAITALYIVFSVLGFFSSLTVLFLVKIMKKWNGYLAIIWLGLLFCCVPVVLTLVCSCTSWCELIFDASFSLYNINTGNYNYIWTAIQFFGGISSSIFTNILSFVIMYIVFKRSSFNILGHFYLFVAMAIIPAALFLILRCYYIDNDIAQQNIFDIYYYCRFFSILFNFGAFTMISRKIYKFTSKTVTGDKTINEIAISTLPSRMIYYPVLQAVTILPAAIYESAVSIRRQYPTTTGAIALDCIMAVTSPSTGIGYLLIFLVMQPNAYKHFRSILSTGRPYVTIGNTSGAVGHKGDPEAYQGSVIDTYNSSSGKDGDHTTSRGSSVYYSSHRFRKDSDNASIAETMKGMAEEELIEEIEKNTVQEGTRNDLVRAMMEDSMSSYTVQ